MTAVSSCDYDDQGSRCTIKQWATRYEQDNLGKPDTCDGGCNIARVHCVNHCARIQCESACEKHCITSGHVGEKI